MSAEAILQLLGALGAMLASYAIGRLHERGRFDGQLSRGEIAKLEHAQATNADILVWVERILELVYGDAQRQRDYLGDLRGRKFDDSPRGKRRREQE